MEDAVSLVIPNTVSFLNKIIVTLNFVLFKCYEKGS